MNKRETDSNENVVTLYVTRHGKTILNTNHRAQGWGAGEAVRLRDDARHRDRRRRARHRAAPARRSCGGCAPLPRWRP